MSFQRARVVNLAQEKNKYKEGGISHFTFSLAVDRLISCNFVVSSKVICETIDLSPWHGDLHKRKISGGKQRSYRKKRRFERGSFPAETRLNQLKKKTSRRHGGKIKIRLLGVRNANISNPSSGKTEKVEILRFLRNPADVDYDRRRVITKGTVIETSLGPSRVTSRPGQHGIVNATLISEKA